MWKGGAGRGRRGNGEASRREGRKEGQRAVHRVQRLKTPQVSAKKEVRHLINKNSRSRPSFCHTACSTERRRAPLRPGRQIRRLAGEGSRVR
ncbi:hypothetical protein BCR35DRAFT_171404 [Leucosporidium creatinivorum]|uniref:Uncharacterized protein n=1 Tax=Leucosporidium creatinivorum TaxID=106004 RepID=A0A1Y2EC76_9BASI|nr:hypothetical protein BCR35DRAFT_171404 [Leucosporidium creatinivorum]